MKAIKNKDINKVVKNKASEVKLFTTREAADYLGIKLKQLDNFKSLKAGPKFTKHENRCYYNKQDLDAWLEARKNVKKRNRSSVNLENGSDKAIKPKGTKTTTKGAVKQDKTEVSEQQRTLTNTRLKVQATIDRIESLIATKTGFFTNKTDIAIFNNIVSVMNSLLGEVEEIKKDHKRS